MFFLFIFSLVTLSDPLPTLSINADSINGKSHISPLDPKATTSVPTFTATRDNNETSQIFNKVGTSTSLPLQMNRDHKSISLLSSPIIALSSELEKRNPANVIRGNWKSPVESKIEVDSRIKRMTSVVSASPIVDQRVSDQDSTPLPLLLKLDREYTPIQIAEYILSTGDEKGFAQGVAEMIEDGQLLVSRDDVIPFLEALQKELANLRSQRVDDGDKVGLSEEENV